MNIESISDYYNTISPSYNELYGREQFEKYEISLSKGNIDLSKIRSILDIGMGSGLLVRYLEEKLRNRNCIYYIGIDIAYELIKKAPKNSIFVFTDYILCDGEEIPVRTKNIDLITLYTVIHHFRNPQKFMDRILSNSFKKIVVSFLAYSSEDIDMILNSYRSKLNNSGEISIFRYRNKEDICVL